MCGLAGVLYFEPRDPREVEALLHRMGQAQAFRGPNGNGLWSDGRVGLSHVRLALVGDEEHGREPLENELVFNGEIYRPAEVVARYGATMGATDSDSHALLLLLQNEGPRGLARVEGMFAAARYSQGTLTLVRDAWGEKPLYFTRTAEAFYFASTLAALKAALPLRVRPEAIQEYLVYKSVGGYRSSYQNVEQLPPGTWIEVDLDGTTRTGRWYEPPACDRTSLDPAEVRAVLTQAVNERLAPNFEQGIFLSGGLDSSLVAAVALQKDQRFRLYSVGYDAEGMQDERPLARRFAQQYPHVPHEEVLLSSQQVPGLFQDVARLLEDPIQDPVTLPTLLLCRQAASRTRCVLTGDGSDEFWGGYERFLDPPATLEEYLPRAALFTDLPPPPSYLDQLTLPELPIEDRILRLEASNRMRNYHLARIDKLGMGCGLEVRAPFLDREVTSLALSAPASLKRHKGILHDAFRDTLPAWLLERKKQPFSVPIAQWLEGPLRDYARDTLGRACRVRAFVDPDNYWHEPAKIWSLLALEAWLAC